MYVLIVVVMALVREEILIKKDGNGADAGAAIITTALSQIGGIIKELEKVAISSPYASFIVGVCVADILHNNKIITDNAYKICLNVGVIGMGVTFTGDILGIITGITDVFSSGSRVQANIFTNSVSTLVTVQGQEDAQLNALLAKK
jgi:hypothetical protein